MVKVLGIRGELPGFIVDEIARRTGRSVSPKVAAISRAVI
jgi:hypothetical protein